MRWAGNVVHTRFWWVYLRGKIPLGRYRPRLEDNIRMDIKSVGTEWTGLIWLVVRVVVKAVVNLWSPKNEGKFID